MFRGKAALIRNMKARGGGGGVTGGVVAAAGVTVTGGGSQSERQPCAYSHGVCSGRRLDHYDYCLRHILEDKGAPYRQCSFTAPKTNRRCTNPAPKSDRKDGRFCKEHAKRAVLSRQKASRKLRPRETAETLLEELTLSAATASDASNDTKRLRRPADSIASKALDYASSSDSDTEVPSVDQAWRRDNDSDAESIDSEHEDPLKHAGVYSQEEAALLLRDKLIRLQSLYIDQFKRLQHVLKEKRRHFLHTFRQEREMLGPIQAYKQDPAQRKKYERLQAMRRYHKFFGKEALLHRKCNQRRTAVAEGVNHRPPVFTRCAVGTPDGRCNKKVLPQSRYCLAHILQDPHQVLFEACQFKNGQCAEPVFSLDEVPLCRRHYAAANASSSSSSSASCAVQTEDLSQETAEEAVDVKIEVDDVPSSCETVNAEPTASVSQESSLDDGQQGTGDAGPSSSGLSQSSELDTHHQGALLEDHGQDQDLDPERLDSSGEAALDIPLLNVSMEEDDLIRFVEGERVDSFDTALNQPPSQ